MNFFVIILLWQHILYLCTLFLVQGGKWTCLPAGETTYRICCHNNIITKKFIFLTQIVLSQHLVSSLSVNGCSVCRMRADCSAVCSHPAYCTVLYCTESGDTRCSDNIICPPEDGHVNARNMSRIVM